MFKKNTPTEPTDTEKALKTCYSTLENHAVDSDEYAKTMKQIIKLEDVQSKKIRKERLFSPDTLLLVGANLAGILLILNYEKADIVTSKALGFVSKSKI